MRWRFGRIGLCDQWTSGDRIAVTQAWCTRLWHVVIDNEPLAILKSADEAKAWAEAYLESHVNQEAG